ncbi:hypothetical protein [Rhodococcus sp. NPDC049939]|uniref:hypothetical protein n=1 Tax=Rhodococcus sp. NPDC049939 TaxID=3155511 RepID=UPI0033F3D498
MKKRVTTMAAAAGLLAGITAVSAPTAQALPTVSGSQVRYVFCSDNQFGNELTYYDNFGMRELGNVTLSENVGGSRFCETITERIDPGSYVWSSISNDNSPYVYAAIYSVSIPLFSGSTGAPPQDSLIARDESYDSYGGLNFAFAF